MGQIVKIELEIEQGAAVQDLEAVKKGFEKVVEEQKESIDKSKEGAAVSAEYGSAVDKATGGAVTKMRLLIASIQGATKSTKALKVALLASGVGAIAVAVGTLAANLGNSEEGANRVSKVMKQLGVIVGNVTDIFYSLGTAVFALLNRDFDLMKSSFEDATNRIKNFGDETEREIKLQGDLADKQAELNKIERKLILDRSKANRDRAELLEKAANREQYTATQRIEFLKEAGRIEEEITNAEIKAAELRLEIKEQENTLSESSKEDLDEEARLKAAVIDLETARLSKQKEVTSQIVGAINEEKAASKALQAERQKEVDGFIKAQQDITTALEGSVTTRGEFEISAAKITSQQITSVAKQTSDNKKKFSEDEVAMAQAQDAMLLDNIIALAGEGSAVGKAAALTQATIKGIEGVQNAYTTAQASPITALFPAYPYVQAGIAAAFTAKQIQSIMAVPAPASAKTSVATPRGAGAQQQAPAFNIVGSSPTNQLAQAIGDREQQPVRAYVVSSEMTTQQSLDRNITNTASLG